MTINSSSVLTGESAIAFCRGGGTQRKTAYTAFSPERQAQLREMDSRSLELYTLLFKKKE